MRDDNTTLSAEEKLRQRAAIRALQAPNVPTVGGGGFRPNVPAKNYRSVAWLRKTL